MLRMLANLTLGLLANAIGLIVAALILDGVSLSAKGFLLAVAIFTGVLILAQPLIVKLSFRYASALAGSTALIAVLVSLLVTDWLTDGLEIERFVDGLLATVVVWAASLVGAMLLPMVLFKKVLGRKDGDAAPKPREVRWG